MRKAKIEKEIEKLLPSSIKWLQAKGYITLDDEGAVTLTPAGHEWLRELNRMKGQSND